MCGNNDNTRVKYPPNFDIRNITPDVFSARRTTEHYHYRILECRKCGMVFSSPVLPYEKLADLYKDSKLNYTGEVNDIGESYIRYVKENMSLFPEKQKALEIGCGSGFFLKELKKLGFGEVYGVEPSLDAVEKSGDLKDSIFPGFFEDAGYEPGSFDLVACFQTLDHLIHPGTVLKKTREILKPGGIGYFIVHNEKGLQAKILGEKSPIYDVEHIYLFNKETLPGICRQEGFEIVKVFDVTNIYPLRYWLRMAPIPFKGFFTKITGALGLLDRKVAIKPGNIGILIRKP
jgi:SAM-dependent methyltransferase